MKAFTNARGLANGASRVEYRYEDWGPLKAVVYCGDTACADAAAARKTERGYDVAGNLTSITDSDFGPGAMYETIFDVLGRPQQVTTHSIPGGDRTLTYGYDHSDNLETFDLSDGGTVYPLRYRHNALNQLYRVETTSSPTGPAFELSYEPDDSLRQLKYPATVAGQIATDYRYTLRGLLGSVKVRGAASIPLEELSYGFLDDGSIQSIEEKYVMAGPGAESFLYQYGYDAQNRLKSADYPAAIPALTDETFVYDAVGNRKERNGVTSYLYDSGDRITQTPEWPVISPDEDGNVTGRTNASRVQTLGWDRLNQLTSFADTQGPVSASYKYDAFGRRVQKVSGSATTWYLWAGDRLLAEYDGAGARQSRYVYTAGWSPRLLLVPDGGGAETAYEIHSDHFE